MFCLPRCTWGTWAFTERTKTEASRSCLYSANKWTEISPEALAEGLLVWWYCPVAAWNKAVGDEGARANSWLFKLWIISIPGFSPPPGSLSLLTVTGIRGKAEETKGDEIQMNPLCHSLAARLPNTQGEAAAALLWVSILHAILVPPAACNIEWAAWKWSGGWKKKGGGSSLQQ